VAIKGGLGPAGAERECGDGGDDALREGGREKEREREQETEGRE